MDISLGYSTGVFFAYNIPLLQKVELIYKTQSDAIELGFTKKERLKGSFDTKLYHLVKKFKYRSIHAPVIDIRYPSKDSKWIIEKVLTLAENINANTVLFHPDLIDDFVWLNKQFGNLLAFENMDRRKPYGKSVKDMKEVFNKSPKAKWVFDVNHLYTINKTMSKTTVYYESLKDRLCHYHLSGYGGFHAPISVTKENIIFDGITDLSVPIICEGGSENMKELISQEHNYVLDRLN